MKLSDPRTESLLINFLLISNAYTHILKGYGILNCEPIFLLHIVVHPIRYTQHFHFFYLSISSKTFHLQLKTFYIINIYSVCVQSTSIKNDELYNIIQYTSLSLRHGRNCVRHILLNCQDIKGNFSGKIQELVIQRANQVRAEESVERGKKWAELSRIRLIWVLVLLGPAHFSPFESESSFVDYKFRRNLWSKNDVSKTFFYVSSMDLSLLNSMNLINDKENQRRSTKKNQKGNFQIEEKKKLASEEETILFQCKTFTWKCNTKCMAFFAVLQIVHTLYYLLFISSLFIYFF